MAQPGGTCGALTLDKSPGSGGSEPETPGPAPPGRCWNTVPLRGRWGVHSLTVPDPSPRPSPQGTGSVSPPHPQRQSLETGKDERKHKQYVRFKKKSHYKSESCELKQQ